MAVNRRYRCHFCGAVLPAWFTVAQQPTREGRA
jgi:hypothetical protein